MLTPKQWTWWVVTGAYAFAILVASVIITPEPVARITYLDKCAHFCIYAGLGLILFEAFSTTGPGGRYALATILIATGYGLIIEGIQFFLPWRSAEVLDALMNCLGSALGVGIARILPNLMREAKFQLHGHPLK